VGERIALIGQNGAGKTTLIRCILGQYVYDGNLKVLEMNPRTEREKILHNVGFVPQIPPPLKMTVKEMLEFFSQLTKTPEEKFITLSEELGLSIKDNLRKPFLQLSGGMKQKLLVSLALGKNPKILLMDEPSANLDPKAREVFFQYLTDFNKDALMILSSHRMDEISTLVTRIVEMDLGNIVLDEVLYSSASLNNMFEVSVTLTDSLEELENILTEWKFERNSNNLCWHTIMSEMENKKFGTIISRYSGIVSNIQINRIEK
jgi:ABC-2 type transport system ATP-binding protein